MDAVTLHHGDALDVLRGLADDSVDAVVTDPPYGLSDHDAGDVAEALACWLSGEEYVHGRGGFMGRSWDAFVPGPVLWREVYRVLKPGGHLLCFAGTRTQDLMGIAIRLAGFECRDTLQWLYGSGFPKSHDVSKAIDRNVGEPRPKAGAGRIVDRNALDYGGATGKAKNGLTTEYTEYPPNTDAARQWDGWGTALKPAHEPILVFRKPLVGTVAANVQQYGTGALNIAACRVGTGDNLTRPYIVRDDNQVYNKGLGAGVQTPPAGRWPPNVALSHAPGCERVGTRRVRGATAVRHNSGGNTFGGDNRKPPLADMTYADADGLETVDDWRCVDGCAVKALALQSGVSKSTASLRKRAGSKNGNEAWATIAQPGIDIYGGHNDTGTAARFFPNFEPSPLDALDAPWLYTAKASRREREAGLEGMPERDATDLTGRQADSPGLMRDSHGGLSGNPYKGSAPVVTKARNTHPTVKSLSLMRWLVRLITPPGGVVLDCFLGSGTTGMAAVMEGFAFVGVEQDAEYIEIARRRIAWAQEQQPPLLRATGN